MNDKRHIFNASFYTTENYQAEWRKWLDEIFLPFVTEQVPDSEQEIFEVQSEVNQGMLVFAVQIRCSSPGQLETLQKESVSVFNDFRSRFGERVANFNSVLIKID
jgi:hypothetical protein